MAPRVLMEKKGTGISEQSLYRTLTRNNSQGTIADARGNLPPTRFQERKRVLKRGFKRACKWLCGSKVFATATTLLTIYALFGDDMRLMFSSKKEDPYFDIITWTAMAAFSIEIVAFSGGKPEYPFAFFFWLDIIATITLILDITTVSETLFGDSISSGSAGSGGGGNDSESAARAARMSRAGTKAGRVVRLIRLLRLIKMIKVFKKDDKDKYQNYPGEDWDGDEEEESNVQESAVSKKLSEMTTRRVIVLVLIIMLTLPIFSPDMFKGNMDSAGQFGLNVLYRRWREGLYAHLPSESASNEDKYLASTERQVYEDIFLLYLYKHNWFTGSDVPSDKASPNDSFNRLFWLGVTPVESPLAKYMPPVLGTYDWNARWNNPDYNFFSGDLPAAIQAKLKKPWNTTATSGCGGRLQGYSLIESEVDEIRCPADLRYQERTALYPQLMSAAEGAEISFVFVFDRRDGSKFEAMLNTFQTIFVCLILGVGSVVFKSDANKLVLAPIERMICKLDRIRNNPLEALKIGDEEHHKEQVKAHRASQREGEEIDARGFRYVVARIKLLLRAYCPCCRRCLGGPLDTQVPEPMETQVLERTIIKIGSLLALGFGEAGAQIIGQNMKDGDQSSAVGMMKGEKVEAVFAYLQLRNFTDCTEVLQDQVMQFVNRIAKEVHSLCDEFWGNPNKNVGEAFLLVWRLSGQLKANEQPLSVDKQRRLTDMSLLSLTSMVAKIATSAEMAEYREHSKLLKRIPNYRVKVGFGLHLGWAIEGAIGSEFKIDASYLSPNVNMAARLESETKYYGSNILLSEAVRDFLTDEIADECRLIDFVDLAGGSPIKVYTLDLDDHALKVDMSTDAPISKPAKMKRRWERQRRKNERWNDSFEMHELFKSDENIAAMRERYTEEFACRFKMAYLNYEAGNWPIAKTMLEETRFLVGIEDGASSALLRFLQLHDNVAPKNWRGFRPYGVQAKVPLLADLDGDGRPPLSSGSFYSPPPYA